MTFKKVVGKLHLWLGLSSGLVVLIVALTGCIYVFQKEISETIYHKTFFVKVPAQAQTLPISLLKINAENALGSGKPINFIITYRDAKRAWEFSAYKAGPDDAVTYFQGMDYYAVAYLNPYTGAVTGVIDYKYEFFNTVKGLHWSLLLSTPYGQPIVGTATLIFVIMMITGMILWWPKKWNKANIQKSFKVKWNASFKRKNYDLHNVPGFYILLPAIIISFTGLVWAFSWFQAAVYVVSALSVTPPENKVVYSDTSSVHAPVPVLAIDKAFANACSLFPNEKRIGISPAADKAGVITATAYRGEETYYDYDEVQYDQYSGTFLQRHNYSEKNRGEKLIGMNYDIHVGAILGLPGKILAFIASLVVASLPVTGFLIWWGRRNKKAYKPLAK